MVALVVPGCLSVRCAVVNRVAVEGRALPICLSVVRLQIKGTSASPHVYGARTRQAYSVTQAAAANFLLQSHCSRTQLSRGSEVRRFTVVTGAPTAPYSLFNTVTTSRRGSFRQGFIQL